jgi:hypothetical protein|mmetsp:Transcript_72640/g.122258  ORF Transcript_72640/g.122258 Transcript_72640/m.122258 type:complete len:189 (-) Transcript_72640:1023-1589(-)
MVCVCVKTVGDTYSTMCCSGNGRETMKDEMGMHVRRRWHQRRLRHRRPTRAEAVHSTVHTTQTRQAPSCLQQHVVQCVHSRSDDDSLIILVAKDRTLSPTRVEGVGREVITEGTSLLGFKTLVFYRRLLLQGQCLRRACRACTPHTDEDLSQWSFRAPQNAVPWRVLQCMCVAVRPSGTNSRTLHRLC